jgi:hypothetical protein
MMMLVVMYVGGGPQLVRCKRTHTCDPLSDPPPPPTHTHTHNHGCMNTGMAADMATCSQYLGGVPLVHHDHTCSRRHRHQDDSAQCGDVKERNAEQRHGLFLRHRSSQKFSNFHRSSDRPLCVTHTLITTMMVVMMMCVRV